MSILDSPDYRDVLYKEKFESFDARCIDILGEVVYYRALLYSHNNVSYHKALGDDHTLQACAFNTDNAINLKSASNLNGRSEEHTSELQSQR